MSGKGAMGKAGKMGGGSVRLTPPLLAYNYHEVSTGRT